MNPFTVSERRKEKGGEVSEVWNAARNVEK